jgi:hypothetical protein
VKMSLALQSWMHVKSAMLIGCALTLIFVSQRMHGARSEKRREAGSIS